MITENSILINRMIQSYIKFFGSYLIIAMVGIIAGVFSGHRYQDFVIWIMLLGSIFMIFSIIFLNKKNGCLRVHTFYTIHLIWVAFLILIGVMLKYTVGFTDRNEFLSDNGAITVVFSNTIYYDIFVFLSHAFILSTLILIISSIRTRKIKPIIMAISSLIIIIIYFVLTV